jgi:hypothetical protein
MEKIISMFVVGLLAFTFVPASGQDCTIYSDYKEGTTTKMVHYDKKNKPTGFTITSVKERKDIPGGVSVLFHQVYDNNDDYTFESEFEVKCVDGEVKMDMSKLIDPTMMSTYEGMEFDVNADDLSIPKNASPGDVLDDGSVTVTVNTPTPVKVSFTVTLSNRKVESKETIVTPAGSFDCLKITYDILTQVGFMKVRASSAEYHNKKHGIIKSESFNKKGKSTGYSVIEEISN